MTRTTKQELKHDKVSTESLSLSLTCIMRCD